MGDRIEQGDAGKGAASNTADGDSGFRGFVSDLWSKAGKGASDLRDAGADLLDKGQEAGGKLVDNVREELQDVDTDKLKEQGKQAAKTGIDVYQGERSTGNDVVDGIIDFGKELNPFKGATDTAVELGEKGLDGKPITQEDMKDAAKEVAGSAARSFVPIPGSETLQKVDRLQQLDRKYGISDRVVDAVNSGGDQAGDKSGAEEAGANQDLPKVDIVDDAVDGAKKLGRRFGGFLRSLGGGNDKNDK